MHCVGTPGLDAILKFPKMSDDELSKHLGAPIPKRYALIVQHPLSTRPETACEEIAETLTANQIFGDPRIPHLSQCGRG